MYRLTFEKGYGAYVDSKEKELDKIKVLTVAEMFGEAIKKIFSNESVSVLF